MVDLLDLLNAEERGGSGWTTLFEASAINDNGLIVGEGVYTARSADSFSRRCRNRRRLACSD